MSSSAITGPILSDTRRAPAGTAAAPSFAFNDSTGTGVYLVSAGVLGLSTNGAQRVVVDASGTVGIGVVPTTGWFSTYRTLQLGTYASLFTNNDHVTLANNVFVDTAGTDKYANSDFGSMYRQVNGQHQFWSAASGTAGNNMTLSQNMTLDASGNLLVGKTSTVGSYKLQVDGGIYIRDSANNIHIDTSNSNGFTYLPQVYNKTSAQAANVYVGSAPGDMYRSTSAAKYKTNVRPLENCLAIVANMAPIRYNSLCESDPKDVDYIGFIADNEEKNVPELVVKNSKGEVEGFSYDRMTAVLVKAIQEQQEIIGKLEARLAALEAK
jgi:hypothetical protein